MGGGGGPSSSTTKTEIDPWQKEQIEKNLDQINAIGQAGYQPFPGSPIAELTPAMMQQLQQSGMLGQLGMGGMVDAMSGMSNIAQNASAQQVTPQTAADPSQIQAQQTQAQQINAGQANLDPYMNPYQQQVVDQTMADIDRSRQMAVNQSQDQALSRGAFNGSRSALVDAETNRAYANQAAQAAGQLNQQGYNTALSAAQNQQQMDLAAQQANQGTDLQSQLANAQMGMQAQLANQQAGMQNNQFNVSNDLQAQLANQGAGLSAQQLQMMANQGLLSGGAGMFGYGQQAADYLQNRQQGLTDWDIQQWQQARQQPWDLANLRTGAVSGMPTAMNQTTTGGGGTNKTAGAMGSALSGASAGAMVGGPWGALIGGGIGLLGGMMG